MAIVMNMGSYEIERTSVEPNGTKLRLRTESDFAFDPIQLQTFVPSHRQGCMPWQLATADVEKFLQRMDDF